MAEPTPPSGRRRYSQWEPPIVLPMLAVIICVVAQLRARDTAAAVAWAFGGYCLWVAYAWKARAELLRRALKKVDSAAPCVELDGCCVTHSPCFRQGTSSRKARASACQGWPCPVGAVAYQEQRP